MQAISHSARGWAVAWVVLACVYAAAAARADPPSIPTQFVCDTMLMQYGMKSVGRMYENDDAREYHWILRMPSLISNEYDTTWEVFHFDDEQTFLVNGQCRNSSSPFASIFAFMPYTSFLRNDTVHGTPCEMWGISISGSETSVCVADDDIPLRMRVMDKVTGVITLDWYFINFVVQVPTIPLVPLTCMAAAQDFLCPGGSIEDTPMIRFHDMGDYTLRNKNTADMLGDTAFICMTSELDMRPGTTAISKFIISTNTSWGQYGFCNNDECIGGNKWSVGREATTGLLPYGGQCADLSQVGTWYSLRADAMCEDGPSGTSALNAGKCAWQVKQLVKTIDLSCLASHSFLDQCVADGGLPFENATNTLQRAFDSSDPNEGGCPDVQPSAEGIDALTRDRTHVRVESEQLAGRPVPHLRQPDAVFMKVLEHLRSLALRAAHA